MTISSSNDSLLRQFESARRELLELRTSNRLLNTPRDAQRGVGIEIKEESTQEVFRMLVKENKSMRFEEGELVEVPIEMANETGEAGEEPGGDSEPTTSPQRRTTKRRVARADQQVFVDDDILHTPIDPNELDRRLNRLVTDSSALMQEQGVNVLYLATGFLQWFESNQPDRPRHAPLILIPVKLNRGRGGGRFSLEMFGDEITTNITLKMRLLSDFGIQLPDLPETEDIDPRAYFDSVKESIAGQPGWEILPDDMVLWFYSFSKLLMYRDLDPTLWPHDYPLEERPLIKSLLQNGFPPAAPLISDNENIDTIFDPQSTLHVIDSDSSQSLVVEEALMGRSLVIQGPPGTGKSQAITNLIAGAIADGKKILFVAEKMAALEVVQRRLGNIGLGGAVLELHSHKTNKREVLQEIDRTLKLGDPQIPNQLENVLSSLCQRQELVNRYADILHQPFRVEPPQPSQSELSDLSGQSNENVNSSDIDLETKVKTLPSDSTPHSRNAKGSTSANGFTPYEIFAELIDLRLRQVPLPDFQIPEAPSWTRQEFTSKRKSVEDLMTVIETIGDPDVHPWRGCEIDTIIPLDLERFVTSVPQRAAELNQVEEAAKALADQLSWAKPKNLLDVHFMMNAIDAIHHAPNIDPQPMRGTAWKDHAQHIQQIADDAVTVMRMHQHFDEVVQSRAWDLDVEQDLIAYRQHGKKFFRMFNGDYRRARKTLRSHLIGKQPKDYDQRVAILEGLQNRSSALKRLIASNVVGERAFGKFWLGQQTDWQGIAAWTAWDTQTFRRGVPAEFRSLCANFQATPEIKECTEKLRSAWNQFTGHFKTNCQSIRLNLDQAFSKWQTATSPAVELDESVSWLGNTLTTPFSEVRSRIESWAEQPDRLHQWQTYRRSLAEIQTIAKGEFVKRIIDKSIPVESASDIFRFAFAESVLREIVKAHPELESFNQSEFEKAIAEFGDLDIQRIELARAQIAKAHWDFIGEARGPDLADAISLLRHEMQKQRRHLPLRELLRRAGTAIQAIKPVFMMSPISVAQYLEPGVLNFDILLIDEASQVRPVDALGAAARCYQMVVVGDDKQMPPTQFFGRTVGEIEEEDETDMQAGDVESVLGLAIARNMPQRMLRWHYRSKHESLIAVSNREFYENQLYIIPSPQQFGDLGVQWRFIEGGKFLKGRNLVEAEVVALAIMQHAKDHPKQTLGVAAFSITQRDAILSELGKLRRKDLSCEAFFDAAAADPFFVKNLENVQGDERDVIFVSVGYGPDEDGRVAMNFGPVSNSGGERRLNVLMTRAKNTLVIFSSMNPEDVDLTRATGRGPAVMREYLRFARDRALEATTTEGKAVQAAADKPIPYYDPIAKILKRELEQRSHQVAMSVGIAGIFVDVAVIDPESPGRYPLGIRIDGPQFGSARSARDRNRTTDGVLGAQGWVLHHVWSPEFFRNPQQELNRILEKIEPAKQGKLQTRGVRLASSRSQIQRRTGGLDPLAAALGQTSSEKPTRAPRRPPRQTTAGKSTTDSSPTVKTKSPPTSVEPRASQTSSSSNTSNTTRGSTWTTTLSNIWQGFTGAVASVIPAINAALKAKPSQRMEVFFRVLLTGRKTAPRTRKKK